MVMGGITAQNVPASWCNLTGSSVLHFKIFAKLDTDLCVPFYNLHYRPHSNCLVNTIIPQEL